MATSCVIFRQLFEKESSTYTYVLGCKDTQECVLIDPVLETVDRDLKIVTELGLTPVLAINTHCHADHITGTALLKVRCRSRMAFLAPRNDY
jgi:sulfur dioxygenase